MGRLSVGAIMAGYLPIVAPKGLPAERLETLHRAFKSVMADAKFQKAMKEKGLALIYEGPADIRKRLARDFEDCRDLMKAVK